jgi:hypothetical protein
MTKAQIDLARHALGLPNKNNVSYRNHFCVGPSGEGYAEWLKMVAEGNAVRKTSNFWGGDDMFHLTLKGALAAREPKEHLSPEDTAIMRELGDSEGL